MVETCTVFGGYGLPSLFCVSVTYTHSHLFKSSFEQEGSNISLGHFCSFCELYSSNQSHRLVVAHLLERAELTAMVKVAIDCRVSSEVFPKRLWFLPIFKDNNTRFFFAGGMFSLLSIQTVLRFSSSSFAIWAQ